MKPRSFPVPTLAFPVLLLACRKPEPIVQIQRVEIPIAVPCAVPPRPSRPASLVAALPASATADQRAKALLGDLVAWMGYALEQELLLDAYRPKPQENRR